MEFRHGGSDAHGRTNNFIGRFRIDVTDKTAPKANALPAEVRRALAKSETERTADDNNHLLWAWGQTNEKAKPHAEAAFNQLSRWPEGDSVLNLANRKNEHRRTTHILKRGSWQAPGEAVGSGVPKFLHDLPDDDIPANRLTLARWLTDRNSPTTARVVVTECGSPISELDLSRRLTILACGANLPSTPNYWTGYLSNSWSLR